MSQQSSLGSDVQRRSGTPETAGLGRGLILVGIATPAISAALYLIDSAPLRLGLGLLLAASTAYLLLGPAMTVTLRLLNDWGSPRS
jgi:hypothetical protein